MVIDLWEKIGALDEMDLANVLAKIFATYEEKLLKIQMIEMHCSFSEHYSRWWTR